jgi:hypothetical protein
LGTGRPVERQAITNSRHAVYANTERAKCTPETMDVYPETHRIERRLAIPRRSPDLPGGDNALNVPSETRQDAELLERKGNPLSTTCDVVVVVLNMEVAIVVDIWRSCANRPLGLVH